MSRFNANDCHKLKQLLNKRSVGSNSDSQNKTSSHFKIKTNTHLNKRLVPKKKFTKGLKTKNESIFRSNTKQDFNKRIKSRNFGESRETRSLQLKEKAFSRLNSSQFRSINEYLYSHSSSEANNYLTNEMFNNYHSIYEKIVEKWPQKPIDYIINNIKTYIKKGNNEVQIADIGCGNLPQIAIAFPKAMVHSFDLISSHEKIITADMTRLPLNNSECDFAVFSLSLMANNLRDCLAEANRILKLNGRLIIVEVLSRFDGNEDSFAKIMSQYGFELKDKHLLPPNSFFIYFEFNKSTDCKKRSRLPDIALKPCFYKPR